MKKISLKVVGLLFVVLTALGLPGFSQESKTYSKIKLYETPIDAQTGLPATASSTYVYFGVFPKTVLPLDSTVTVDETEGVMMGNTPYFKGSNGEYYAKALENANDTREGYNYADCTYTDNTQTWKKNEGSYRYFKMEPIKWKVLTADYKGTGKALLLAEDILTANVPYYESASNRTIDGKTVYPNNYKHSQIRAYLNGLAYQGPSGEVTKWNGNGFLQTAFTEAAQAKIATTEVDNSAESTTDAGTHFSKATDYACENTSDKIFLLSLKEVTNTSYRFGEYYSWLIDARIRKPTDYAKANYAWQHKSDHDGGRWWLRSPICNYYSYYAGRVSYDGNPSNGGNYVYDTSYGIVPALSLSLE